MRFYKGLLIILFLLISFPVFSDVEPISGGDEMNDSTYRGLAMFSTDREVAILFVCKSGKKLPTITFMGSEFLTGSGDEFFLEYRVDKNEPLLHYFKAGPNNHSGQLVISSDSVMKIFDNVRFGKKPSNEDFENSDEWRKALKIWEKNFYFRFITNFMKGKSALVRVTNYRDQKFTYRFDLKDLVDNQNLISDCYS